MGTGTLTAAAPLGCSDALHVIRDFVQTRHTLPSCLLHRAGSALGIYTRAFALKPNRTETQSAFKSSFFFSSPGFEQAELRGQCGLGVFPLPDAEPGHARAVFPRL